MDIKIKKGNKFVNPARYLKDTYIFPPLHLLYISQSIRRTGHEAEVVDIPYLININPEKFNIQDDSGINYEAHLYFYNR